MSARDQELKGAIVQHGKDVAMEVGMEMVKEGLQEALEIGAGPVGGIVKAGAALWSIFNVNKFAKYLGDLALELDCNDPGALRQLILEHGDKEWVAEGLDRGFRKIMEATDPIAKKCILVMVADYMKRGRLPDRKYQMLGRFLESSDAHVLSIGLQIAEGLAELSGNLIAVVLSHRSPITDETSYQLLSSQESATKRIVTLRGVSDKASFGDTCAVFERTGFLSTWAGFGITHPEESTFRIQKYFGAIEPHHRELWEQLRPFLAPAGS